MTVAVVSDEATVTYLHCTFRTSCCIASCTFLSFQTMRRRGRTTSCRFPKAPQSPGPPGKPGRAGLEREVEDHHRQVPAHEAVRDRGEVQVGLLPQGFFSSAFGVQGLFSGAQTLVSSALPLYQKFLVVGSHARLPPNGAVSTYPPASNRTSRRSGSRGGREP